MHTNSIPALQQSLKIGNVHIGPPITQAALSGFSDWPMRVIARRMGAPYTLCEVMLDRFLVSLKNRKRTSHFLHNSAEEHPVGGQLMGAEPEEFSAGAQKLVEAGFDIIDINFGCPVKKAVGKCRGGYHLSDPAGALEIVQRTRDIVPDSIPVTVKMRRGIDDSQESRDHFFTILDGVFSIGVSAVTVHGRTVKQKYIGASRWDFLSEVKQHLGSRIVLGSGDLFTPQDCVEMLKRTGVDGVSIARGAIGNPWVFPQLLALLSGQPLPDPPGLHEQRDTILTHYSLAESIYGDMRCGQLMRKFGIKYAVLHPHFEQVRKDFAKAKNREQWEEVLHKWYREDLPGVHPEAKRFLGNNLQKSCVEMAEP